MPAPTRSTSTSKSTAGSCTYTVKIVGQWTDGLRADFVVTNTTDVELDGWRVTFDLPSSATLNERWGGTFVHIGDTVRVTPTSYNTVWAAGGDLQFGFVGGAMPTASYAPKLSLQGTPCSRV